MTGQIVTIATIQYPDQADALRTILESNGIECFLPGEQMRSVRPELISLSGGIPLKVRESDAERAKQIVEQNMPAAGPREENPSPPPEPEKRPKAISLPTLIFIIFAIFMIFWHYMYYFYFD